MGDSLEQWRAAIGTFSHPKSSTENTRIHPLKRSPKRPSVPSVNHPRVRTNPGLRVFPLLLVIVTLLLVIGGVQLNPGPKDTKLPFEILLSSEHSNLDHPLDSVLGRHGLGIIENSGLGDCLFEALSDQLKRLTSIEVNANDLRKSLLECIQAHPILPNDEHVMTLFDSEANTEWQEYAANNESTEDLHIKQLSWYTNEYMVRPGVWGDNLMLYAFTKLYNIDVAIYTAGTDEPYTMTADDESGGQQRMTARLGYIPHLHFISLVDRTDRVYASDEDSMMQMSDKRLLEIQSLALDTPGEINEVLSLVRNIAKILDLPTQLSMEELDDRVQLMRQIIDDSIKNKHDAPDGLIEIVLKLASREVEKLSFGYKGALKKYGAQATRDNLNEKKDAASESR
ncbi:unnamed protein product [Owenia fusiformis]|uniref:Uncharacterized protein n=1 Tax=Owenia fusiformis TaxID=6347 RepID=A0A8J1YBE5_OWEFU|nr:unnamed protein product [Owenia fusiformis]